MRMSGSVPLARSSSQVSAALGFDFGFGIVEVEFDAVEVLLAEDGHAGKDCVAGLECAGAGDGGVFLLVGNVEVDAAVLVLTVLGLESGDKLAESLALPRP